jgi:hypothetical protein
MINKYDIIVIALIIIIVAIIVVINVKKTLNDKLTNVEVKIPEIEIPKSNIVVKVQKECGSDQYDVHVQKEDNFKEPTQKVGLSPSTQFVKNIKTVENFRSVGDSQDNQQQNKDLFKDPESMQYDPTKNLFSDKELSEDEKEHLKYKNDLQRIQPNTVLFKGRTMPKTIQEDDVSEEEEAVEIIPQYKTMFPTTDRNVEFPDEDQIVDYGKYVCMAKPQFEKLNYHCDPNQIKRHNTEVVQSIIEHDKKYDKSEMDKMNPVDDANRKWDEDDHYDYLEYFLKHRQFIPSSFEDGVTRGSNVADYDGFAGLNDIGKIKLGRTKYKYPKPNNYLFSSHTS